jgi:hypothetical protein
VGDSEDGAFWTAILGSVRARGLAGAKLALADAHEDLRGVIVGVVVDRRRDCRSPAASPWPEEGSLGLLTCADALGGLSVSAYWTSIRRAPSSSA